MRQLAAVGMVVFDCDSTLSAIEGIDELGREWRAEIEALTAAAMRGDVPLEAVYGRRLELIRPNRAQIDELAQQYVQRLVPDARQVVGALRECGIATRIMSGGLLPAVRAVADALALHADDVAAVGIRFTEDGAYAGFDEDSPLARSGGKREVLEAWRTERAERVMMVGDGATDLEAADVADVFVAYAGVVARAPVIDYADAVVHSASLAPVLPLALGGARPTGGDARVVFERGLVLLDEMYLDRLPNLNR
jgi:phosphoserine phosphatase